MPQFFFAVGPNGAGKSSLADNLVPNGTVIINGDEIRRESKTLHAAEQKTKSLLEGAVTLRRPIYYESNFLDPGTVISISLFVGRTTLYIWCILG